MVGEGRKREGKSEDVKGRKRVTKESGKGKKVGRMSIGKQWKAYKRLEGQEEEWRKKRS